MNNSVKMFAALLVMVATLVFSAAVVFAEGTNYKGTINGDTVNVRAKPDTSSKILVQLAKGTAVAVTVVNDNWCKVSKNGVSGWVSRQFIIIRETVIAKGTVKGNDVNVRSKPDVSSEKIAQLGNGTKVDIVKKSGAWYRIAIDGNKYGWVNCDYIVNRDSTPSRGSDDTAIAAADDKTQAAADDGKVSAVGEDLRQQVVAYAKKFLGVRYVYGGSSPKGFDCSGFVQYVFKHFGIELDRSADEQALNGKKISKSELKPGDTVFFDTNGGHNAIEHAGLYIGDGKFIHASSGSSAHKVVISDINEGFYDKCYMWARRVIDD